MLITGNKEEGFKVHFNKEDLKSATGGVEDLLGLFTLDGPVLVELTAEKAKELEDRLEEVVNPKEKGGD